ncbi:MULTISPECIES: glycine cleavage system protein GcvH [Leptolyngbya]|jgi:glycine cleavage system H protein|uniref:Glycine cleavage system H protein n=1 Tax=Leptolyngbya boryana NIES-2135 TaxID=1973484 RepID=A0A1Z4JL64_LEPBY|nr:MULTISPECIES: glycine cleavage system protein GcvH [Leptolyngbya]BAY57474.1 glycine cleavage system H protein [Leptolyngbya boryana NIES-2135]MBD1859194.1 glycine cleavage system protein GcvH [Leptolyngbya sp. FACHB-1624]MBD2368590.1 glycine cleavage system protein GcvH [Leptolyngbya sp. FACHB-161]MBD2375149.1 glycine cleavage system protein GcvH [Leptolyngbya sp. FACHB-238]MBD2399568.1 glycine cleavage system protein GcvH [Leptolyngbya sp. FACHB-239]
MAFEYPDTLKYTDSHEYVQLDGDTATIGITAFAIDQLGDIVFLELPEPGTEVQKGENFGTVESVKAVEDLKSPVSGTVLEANTEMMDSPEKLVDAPYTDGWLIKVQISDSTEIDDAMSADEYRAQVEGA